MILCLQYRKTGDGSLPGDVGHRLCERGETCSTAEATRGHYIRLCQRAAGGLKLSEPAITREARGLTEMHRGRLTFFTTAAVPTIWAQGGSRAKATAETSCF